MTLVYNDNKIAGASTHAIVIGVGEYQHIRSLRSPPESAREFANWVITKYNNPDGKRLATLDLLISERDKKKITTDNGQQSWDIESATKDNVEKAVKDWFHRGNNSLDDVLIFYFCGHGKGRNPYTVLLLEDYGEDIAAAEYENTINIDGLHLGMDKCMARSQCYFIDACRSPSRSLNLAQNPGDPIIEPDVNLKHNRSRRSAMYFSTLLGEQAYGNEDGTSLYTDALIKSLNGSGAHNYRGRWIVTTTRLNLGVSFLLKEEKKTDESLDQESTTWKLDEFELHHIVQKPVFPVQVGCIPDVANEFANLSYRDVLNVDNKGARDSKSSSDWIVEIENGEYNFSAKFVQFYRDSECIRIVYPQLWIPIECEEVQR